MACEQWREQLDAYADGELDSPQANVLAKHLPGCVSCAADVLARVQMKRSVQMAGKRYTASAEFRKRIAKSIAAKPSRQRGSLWQILVVPALAMLILSVAANYRATWGARSGALPAACIQRTRRLARQRSGQRHAGRRDIHRPAYREAMV